MPIYVYECRKCGTTFDMVRSIDEADLPVKCPCGGPCTKKVVETNFILKGGGWPGKDNKGGK